MSEIVRPIEERRAKRALSDRPIPREMLEAVLHAAHLAPSCNNTQPWRLIAIDDAAVLDSIKDAMPGGNYWTKPAPAIIAVVSRRDLDCTLSDGRDYFLFGCGMAIGNLMLQATHMELIAHPIAGFKSATIKGVLGIPEKYVLITLVIVGRPGDVGQLSEKHRAIELGPRERRPLEDVVSWNRFEFDDPAPPQTEA